MPAILAAFLLIAGSASGVAGVYILWGTGWACIAGAVPLFGAGAVLTKGLVRGG